MEEKLKGKKLFLKLLGFALVAICVVVVFVPLFSMTKTVEAYGIKETITIKFSAWQMLVQEEKVALESTSALGEFQGFATISMQELLGGEKMALFLSGVLRGIEYQQPSLEKKCRTTEEIELEGGIKLLKKIIRDITSN